MTVLEEARWYAIQGRQTRAYAGLRSETMASADSRRLALYTLEKLPGWPDTLRLEVREGSDSGTLLDSIGSPTAPDKKYLVKKGPRYQAFDERGEALNSLPTEGDNFYASLMHAMPDGARQALGVPHVGQSAQLQAKLVAFADRHRSHAPQWLAPQRSGFKPPVRINDTLVGDYASGRAEGQTLSLESRAQSLYGLSDTQASEYIVQLQAQGKDNKAIFNHLQNREREYTALVSTLDEWVMPARGTVSDDLSARNRTHVAQQLKVAWRNEPLAGKVNNADCLHIYVDERMPLLTTDFSHIHELTVVGKRLSDAEMEAFVARFPNLETLSIGDTVQFWEPVGTGGRLSLTTVPPAVTRMASLKRLRFGTSVDQLAPEFFSTLNSLTALEALHIDYRGFCATALNSLDLSALVQLKQLKIEAPVGLSQWPAHVENLANLERLDLSRTAIGVLPDTLYSGHEQLWAGLSMDWSNFSREAFKPAYEYVSTYKGERGHLVDLHQMVSAYTTGELRSLGVNSRLSRPLLQKIMTAVHTPEARFAVIEELSEQYTGIFAKFYYPPSSTSQRFRLRSAGWQTEPNAHVISALEVNWWEAVGERYGVTSEASVLELPTPEFALTNPLLQVTTVELPELPAASFAHVRTLRLRWQGTSIDQTRGFIRAFNGTQTLELTGLGLTEIPGGADDLPALTRFDLSSNNLAMPALQAQLNNLSSLKFLDLSHNSQPLTNLDVSKLMRLNALNLRATALQTWPTGAESLPQLTWLDLRDNQLVSLQPEVLANDALLMKTNLAGNPFSAAGQAELELARQRVDGVLGLPQGALARYGQQSVPAVFPPAETGLTMARYLLPLPQKITMTEGRAGFVGRLQQLTPAVSEEKALQWFEQLRSTGGMSDPQIDALLTTWHQEYETLTRQLNGWLYTRELPGPDISQVADDRRLVALNIIECWRTGVSAEAGYELSLHGLQTDNFPALTVQFSHVHTLNLTGVRFSVAGVESFLDSFPAVRKLVMSGNELSTVPEAVERMAQLEELELGNNALTDPEPVYRLLGGERLRRLDLHRNNLSEFDAQSFSRLETLDLSYNRLTEWPEGTLQAPNLRTLNLCGNDLRDLPNGLLNGRHHALVMGTDLSENESLSYNSFDEMRGYGNGPVMGWSQAEIEQRIEAFEENSDGSGSGSDDDAESDESLEDILDPERGTSEAVLTSWLKHSPQALAANRRQLWLQLTREPLHERFFHLLERLRDADEYRLSPTDLTRRVWGVVESAAGNAQIRKLLFAASATHGTCIDGRILTFSSLEVIVLVEQVLREVPANTLKLRGQRLLQLSRQLFRLEQIDAMAIRNTGRRDEAEVRLEYRIGMTRGWADGLELPGQPTHMAYGTPVSGQALTGARSQVLAAEASNVFYERLVTHDYWVDYLKERYPDEFQTLQSEADARHEALEDEYALSDPRYTAAVNQLQFDRESARVQLLLELSRKEVLESAPGTVAPVTSGPASPQPGPSTRP